MSGKLRIYKIVPSRVNQTIKVFKAQDDIKDFPLMHMELHLAKELIVQLQKACDYVENNSPDPVLEVWA